MDLYNDSIAKWLKYSDFCSVYKKYYDAECDRKPIPLDEWKKEIKCPVDHSISNSVGPSPVFHDSKYEKDMSVEIVLENGDNEFFLSLYIEISNQVVFSDTINNLLNRFIDMNSFEHGLFIPDLSSFIEFWDHLDKAVCQIRTYTSTARCTPLYEYLENSDFVTSYIDMALRFSRPNSFKVKKADVMAVLKEFNSVNVEYDSGARVYYITKKAGNYSFSYGFEVGYGNLLSFTFFAEQDDERLFLYANVDELVEMYSGKKLKLIKINSIESLRETLKFMINFLEDLACYFERYENMLG